VKLPFQTTHPDVQLEAFEQEEPGFLRITATAAEMQFEYFRVPFGGVPEQTPFDVFTA
jgi:hypothetical protein